MQSSREREKRVRESEREKNMMENGVRERERGSAPERDAGIFLARGEKDASDAGC